VTLSSEQNSLERFLRMEIDVSTIAICHDSIARKMTLRLASTEYQQNGVGRYGTGWNEMGRDPVIAVIVGSRDPATHLNYLYLSPGRRRFHFCISQLDASVIPWYLTMIPSFYVHTCIYTCISGFLQTVAWIRERLLLS